VKPLDPRLLRQSATARGYLVVTVVLGLAATALILFQASLLAHLLARAAASYAGEVTALRAAAARRRRPEHAKIRRT